MEFIRRWSFGLAKALANNLNESHQKRFVYYFGLQVLIGTLVKMAILIAVSLILGVFKETMLITLTFITLRLIVGGYHMDTYGKCLFISALLYLIAGAIVKYTVSSWTTLMLIIFISITFIVSLFSIIKWAPVDTPNKPITNPKEIKHLRRLGFIHISIWLAFNIAMLYINAPLFILTTCFGVLLSILIITPVGIWFFDSIRYGIDKLFKQKSKNMAHTSRAPHTK